MADARASGVLCRFSPFRDSLAIASADGQIRIVDTVSGHTRLTLDGGPSGGSNATDTLLHGELRERVNSLLWFPTATAPSGTPPDHASLLLLGSAEGSISAVDTATADVRWQTVDCHQGGVASMTYVGTPATSILSVGGDGQALRLSPRGARLGSFKAGKGPLACVAVSNDGKQLLVGGSGLALWDLETGKRLLKFNGHQAPVHSLAFTPSDAYVVSAAHGDRHIVAWRTAPSTKKKRRRQAAGLISSQHPVTAMCTCVPFEQTGEVVDADAFQVAGLSSSGEVHVWLCAQGEEGRLGASLRAQIRAGPARSVSSSGVLALQFESALKLLVAHGSAVRPAFEHVSLPKASTPEQKLPASINLESSQNGVLLPSKDTRQPQAAPGSPAAAVVAPHATESLGLAVSDGGRALKRRRADRAVDAGEVAVPNGAPPEALANGPVADDSMAVEDSDAGEGGDDEAALEGPTLGERLAELGILPPEETEEPADPAGLLPEAPSAIQADSLVTLLTQALRSQDKQLLERCLCIESPGVVGKTIRGLLPADAGLLLSAAVQRLQSKPARGRQLSAWLRPLLLHHAAYLMASPGAQASLASLYQLIEARLAVQRPLASLAGRLDLLCAQIPSISSAHAEERPFGGPQVVLQEEAEVEDALAPGNYASSEELDDMEADQGSDLSDE